MSASGYQKAWVVKARIYRADKTYVTLRVRMYAEDLTDLAKIFTAFTQGIRYGNPLIASIHFESACETTGGADHDIPWINQPSIFHEGVGIGEFLRGIK